MSTPIFSKFLFCFDLKTGGVLMGVLDTLLYGSVLICFTLQLVFGIGFIDESHGKFKFEKIYVRNEQYVFQLLNTTDFSH